MLRNNIKKYYASQRLDDNQKRLLSENLSAAYGEQTYTKPIKATHSNSKKHSGKQAYAKGPGLWGVGAVAAAVAVVTGASFFGGLDIDLPFGSSPASYVQPGDNGIGYFNMTIDGVKRTGANNNEINLKNLSDFDGMLTVNLEFPDVHIGEEYNIKSASYCVFMDAYPTIDISEINLAEYIQESGSSGSFFEYCYDDLIDTENGLYAEYTLGNYDHKDDDLAFSIIAIAIFEDYDGNYSMMLDSVYNTAYSDREKVSYLSHFSTDPYPLNSHMNEYFGKNVSNGLMELADESRENALKIVGDPGDNLYVEFFALNDSTPEYAYENAYYLLTFVDGVLLPQSDSITSSSYRYDGLTMVDCLQRDGSPMAFSAPLYVNELNDVHDVRVIAIPARPYGGYGVMTDNLHYGEDDPVSRRQFEMTIDGYERTGTHSNEIYVEDLNGGEDITVQLRIGNSDGRYDNIDIMGATYHIFLDGYSTLNMSSDEKYEEGYIQFINQSGTGEFTRNDKGYFVAEYTFSFDDLNEISRKDKTFTIVAIADVDLDDNRSSDVTLTDALYNVAYMDQNEISYLEELNADNYPDSQGIMTFQKHYDALLRFAGFYHATDDPDYRQMLRNGAGIIENKDDGKVYVSFHASGRKEPEYLFENAYYIFTYVNEELVSLTDDGVLYTLVDCADTDGNDRFLCAELGDISDISGVDVIVVPATPYLGHNGAYLGQAINVEAESAYIPY